MLWRTQGLAPAAAAQTAWGLHQLNGYSDTVIPTNENMLYTQLYTDVLRDFPTNNPAILQLLNS